MDTNNELTFAVKQRLEMEEHSESFMKGLEESVRYIGDTRTKLFINGVAKRLEENHRTSQQGMIGVLLTIIYKYGKEHPTWFDGRNEAAKRICGMLAEWMEEHDMVYEGKIHLPLI